MQEREGAARYPLCSRNARLRKALVGRAQLRATLATPFNTGMERGKQGQPDTFLCSLTAHTRTYCIGGAWAVLGQCAQTGKHLAAPSNMGKRERGK